MAKRTYKEYEDYKNILQNENIDNIEDEYFRILSKDDIKNIMKNYEEQSDSDFHNMKELFKQMYIYDEIEDKCIDIKNESYDNLNTINKKTFDSSITIIDTLKETLKLSEEFIKGNVTFSDDLNPVVFIDMIKNLYENEYDYITTEKYENELFNTDVENILYDEKLDIFKLNKLINKIIKKKNIIDNEFFSSLEFYKEVTVKYEHIIENAYDTFEIDKYILMIKTIVDVYDNNYKIMFSDKITLDKIDESLNYSYFFIQRMRELLCTSAYKISKIDRMFQNSDIYKANVNIQKCRETIQIIENEKHKGGKSMISKFFEYIKNKVSKILSVFLKQSGTILYHVKTYLIKFYIYAANTYLIQTVIKGLQKEVKNELIFGYLGSKITGSSYKFNILDKYNEYILPDEKILNSESVLFIQLIQILGIIFCSTAGTSKEFWRFSEKITKKLLEYINKIFEIKFITNCMTEIKKFFSIIYSSLSYCSELIIDTIYSEFVYSIFSFICGNIVKMISNPIDILKFLSKKLGETTYTSILKLYEHVDVLSKSFENYDVILNDKTTDNLINNVIENGLISIKNTHKINHGTSNYCGELNPFNLFAGVDTESIQNIQSVKLATVGTVIGSFINNITQETKNKSIISDIQKELKNLQVKDIDIDKLSKDIDELSDTIANDALSDAVDILSNGSQYINKNPQYRNESTLINNNMKELKKDTLELLKINITDELYQNATKNANKEKQMYIYKLEDNYDKQKQSRSLLLRILDLIIKLLYTIKNISIAQILYMIKSKAYEIAKYSYSRISESVRQICIKAINLPAVCYNSLSEVTTDTILNKIKLYGEKGLENVQKYCSSPKKFFKLVKKVFKFIKYVAELRYTIYGIKTKIPKFEKIAMDYVAEFSKYVGKKAYQGGSFVSRKALEESKLLSKKYRQYKIGPKIYKEPVPKEIEQKPLTTKNIQEILDRKKRLKINDE
jgi:hypothetical protein